MLTALGVILLGAVVSAVLLAAFVWGRFAVPEQYAPLVALAAVTLWGVLMGLGVLDLLAKLP